MNRVNKWRKENPEKRQEQRKRDKVRASLRKLGILPPPYQEMTNDEKKINDQIGSNDFSYWEKIIKEKRLVIRSKKSKESCENDISDIKKRLLNRAKESKKECNIDISDIEIPEYCPYLGIKLSTDKKDCYNDNYYSIDRIDSTKGYVKGNIQIISRIANTMKSNATIEQLVIFAENIKKLHGT